jgi:lysozyme family protein
MTTPTIFDRCFAALMVHEVDADPLDPKCWSGGAIGVGKFLAPDDGIDLTESDSGNWTGGSVGAGELGGTRWGISTAAYPDALAHLPDALRAGYPVLVKDLTLDQARDLTLYAYWQSARCDDLAGPVALITLDANFNNGVGEGVRWLQTAVDTNVDGECGDMTIGAVRRAVARSSANVVASLALAERINWMARLPGWRIDGHGWSRRLALLPFQAAALPA